MKQGWLSDSHGVETIKRTVYLVALPFSTLAALLLLYLEALQGTLHIVDRIGLPLLSGLTFVLWLCFWRRRGQFFVLELLLFSGFSLMLLASLGYSMVQLSSDDRNLSGLGYWLSVLYTLAFLIFGVRNGLRISLSVYLLALGGWLAEVLLGTGNSIYELSTLFQLFASSGLLLLLLYGFGVLAQLQAEQAARHELEANTDALTRLPNRRFLIAQLTREHERAVRYGRTFSVIMLDLDHFKHINDACGHHAGDETLQETAQLLLTHTRALDTSGRWGGEEFLLLLPELPLAAASEVAERFRLSLEAHTFSHGFPVTASFGVAEFVAGEGLEQLISRADQALYEAKTRGRNCVMFTLADSLSPATQVT